MQFVIHTENLGQMHKNKNTKINCLSEFISESPNRQGAILNNSCCLKLVFIVREMLKRVQQDACS